MVWVTVADAAAKTRTILLLPFATVDVSRDEQWIGEAVTHSLALGLVQVPSVIEIDRVRLKQVTQPEAWDEQNAAAAAKALHADVAIYGEVRRTGGDLVIQPRYLELRADKFERVSLDSVAVPENALMERLRALSMTYVRALKLPVTDSEAARVQKWASPTTSTRAFDPYVRGCLAWYRGSQEGNEAAIELLGKATEVDPQFVVAQYTLGVVHQALGNRWKAAAQFRASTQLDPRIRSPTRLSVICS
jgi:adenylate cyclase